LIGLCPCSINQSLHSNLSIINQSYIKIKQSLVFQSINQY
jgi:hypothetical protein